MFSVSDYGSQSKMLTMLLCNPFTLCLGKVFERLREPASQGHRTLRYRDRLKGVQILLSTSQARPGREVKQEQKEISRNHIQAF